MPGARDVLYLEPPSLLLLRLLLLPLFGSGGFGGDSFLCRCQWILKRFDNSSNVIFLLSLALPVARATLPVNFYFLSPSSKFQLKQPQANVDYPAGGME